MTRRKFHCMWSSILWSIYFESLLIGLGWEALLSIKIRNTCDTVHNEINLVSCFLADQIENNMSFLWKMELVVCYFLTSWNFFSLIFSSPPEDFGFLQLVGILRTFLLVSTTELFWLLTLSSLLPLSSCSKHDQQPQLRQFIAGVSQRRIMSHMTNVEDMQLSRLGDN